MRLRQTLRSLGAGLLLRRSHQELRALRIATEQQTLLLQTLIDRLWPPVAQPEDGPDLAEQLRSGAAGGVDHLDSVESALVEAYVAKIQQQTGHLPTEDQILAYLAEEATQAQHAVMNEQDAGWPGHRRG